MLCISEKKWPDSYHKFSFVGSDAYYHPCFGTNKQILYVFIASLSPQYEAIQLEPIMVDCAVDAI